MSNENPMPTPVPPGAPRSPDGAWWWDGHAWRPAAPTGHPTGAAPTRRRSLPGWAIALIVVGALVLLVPILAAVAIPVYLNQRDAAEHTQVREDLVSVARAEAELAVDTGTYSSDPAVIEPYLTDDLTTTVIILWADEESWCASGAVVGREPIAWYSSTYGLSDQPCG